MSDRTADDYIAAAPRWRSELAALRKVLAATGLAEEMKWGAPCYTWKGRNVVGMAGFKSYFGLWFYQGALLEDDLGVLVKAQGGTTKAQRQWRMHSAKDIRARDIQRYVEQARRVVEDGRELKPRRQAKLSMPAELSNALRSDAAASKAFAKLTPGRQREYAQFVAEAKREATRLRRVEKALPMIRAGCGLNDRYR